MGLKARPIQISRSEERNNKEICQLTQAVIKMMILQFIEMTMINVAILDIYAMLTTHV